MTKVAQIEDRGAAVAWSPVGDHADVIALGAKVSESNYSSSAMSVCVLSIHAASLQTRCP